MSEVLVCRHRAEILPLEGDWDRLAAEQAFLVPRFEDLLSLLEERPGDVLLVACRDDSGLGALACFFRLSGRKLYRAGERRLFSLPVQEVQLFGSSILGKVDRETVAEMLAAVSAEFDFHVLTLGELRVDSPLYMSVAALRKRFAIVELSRKRSIRWRIRLPANFDDYLMSLGAKSRQNIRREMRQIEKQFESKFERVTAEHEINAFLVAAESVSRKTYQWNVGQRLLNDEPTRRSLQHRARRGEMRCYSLALNGQACAFMRGKLVGGTYDFETAGFDPAFGKASPGAVLLMWAVRDLIENSSCSVFDFGTGGDDVGYKSRFGNESNICAALQLGPRTSPYTFLLFTLQRLLFLSLNLADTIIGKGALRGRLKRALRKYGER